MPNPIIDESQTPPNGGNAALTEEEQRIQALADKLAEEKLAKMKENVDKAYKARDTALAQLSEKEQAIREAEIQRLKDAGKQTEALEAELADAKARAAALDKRNIELTRDVLVRTSVASLDFQSDRAQSMAIQEITAGLVQNDKGEWVHRSGKTVSSFVAEFAKDDTNRFLFKQKVNSGGGSPPPQPKDPQRKGSIFEMTQDEVLKLAEKGELRKRK